MTENVENWGGGRVRHRRGSRMVSTKCGNRIPSEKVDFGTRIFGLITSHRIRCLCNASMPTARASRIAGTVNRSLSIYRWTVQFLIHEELIRNLYEERKMKIQKLHGNAPLGPFASPQFESLMLTAKGLAALNAMPKVMQGQQLTFIDRIRRGLAENSTKGIRETITALIAQTVSHVLF